MITSWLWLVTTALLAINANNTVPNQQSLGIRVRQDVCKFRLPSALSYIEPLKESIRPDQIVIITGGDSLARRQSGFANLSADSMKEFAGYNGYKLVFLDEVNYDKSLTYKGIKFHAMWNRVFALPAIRKMFPRAKYFVQMDDDILVPYKETHIVNHLINKMEGDQEWLMTYGEEGGSYVLNSGFFIFKNTDFAFDAYQQAIDIGTENNGHLASFFGHEQEAIVQVRKRNCFEHHIRVLPHRQGHYNFNTFARNAGWDPVGVKAVMGDSIVHYLGHSAETRFQKMTELIRDVEEWRRMHPKRCTYPIQL